MQTILSAALSFLCLVRCTANLVVETVPSGRHDFEVGVENFILSQQQYDEVDSINRKSLYFAKAKTHLIRRATLSYEKDDINEKWQSLFLLGDLLRHSTDLRDSNEAIHWYTMCKQFNPDIMDCSLALAELYLSLGRYDKAYEEYLYMVTSPAAVSQSNSIDPVQQTTWRCKVPQMIIDVLIHKQNKTIGAVKYAVLQALVVSILPEELCQFRPISLSEDMMGWATNMTVQDMCEDIDVAQYLYDYSILLHPCESVRLGILRRRFCHSDIGADAQRAAIGAGANVNNKLLGSANLLDIVHHLYGGDSGRVLHKAGNAFKVLFAGVVSPQNVYMFMQQLQLLENNEKFTLHSELTSEQRSGVKVYVLTDDRDTIRAIMDMLTVCTKAVPPNIEFVTPEEVESKSSFDYIDYRNGVSLNEQHNNEIRTLRSFLSAEGVIGITAFSENAVAKKITTLLARLNKEAHTPFSADPYKFVTEQLNSNGFGKIASEDSELVQFIASNNGQWKKYWTVSGILNLLEENNMAEVALLPLSARSPYDTFADQPTVQKWKSLGMTEADFVEEFVVPFRYTVYAAAKTGAGLPGRPDLIRDSFPANTVFMDRSFGSLGEVFSGLQSQPGSFEALRVPLFFQVKMNSDVSVLRNDEDKTLSLYLAPDVVAGLSLLPSSPTLKDMYAECDGVSELNCLFSMGEHMPLSLSSLAQLGVISVWIPGETA